MFLVLLMLLQLTLIMTPTTIILWQYGYVDVAFGDDDKYTEDNEEEDGYSAGDKAKEKDIDKHGDDADYDNIDDEDGDGDDMMMVVGEDDKEKEDDVDYDDDDGGERWWLWRLMTIIMNDDDDNSGDDYEVDDDNYEDVEIIIIWKFMGNAKIKVKILTMKQANISQWYC